MSALSLTPDDQARIRRAKVTVLHFGQKLCACCHVRRSVGQFKLDPDTCDRCYKRKPKGS